MNGVNEFERIHTSAGLVFEPMTSVTANRRIGSSSWSALDLMMTSRLASCFDMAFSFERSRPSEVISSACRERRIEKVLNWEERVGVLNAYKSSWNEVEPVILTFLSRPRGHSLKPSGGMPSHSKMFLTVCLSLSFGKGCVRKDPSLTCVAEGDWCSFHGASFDPVWFASLCQWHLASVLQWHHSASSFLICVVVLMVSSCTKRLWRRNIL